MFTDDDRVSLADLSAAGIRMRPVDAVTIVRELARQVVQGALAGVPSPHVIRLGASGQVLVEGPMAADGRAVPRAAQLLDALLPGPEAPAEYHVPGRLRLVVARALGTLDLPPYPTLNSFAEALDRFAAPDPTAHLRALVGGALSARRAAPESSQETVSLTISDIRRARRATRLPLAEIATRTRIPIRLLRQLEWGDVREWPDGIYGRVQLVRYARAAGLDEHLVVEIVWPMLEDVAHGSVIGAPPIEPESKPARAPGTAAKAVVEADAAELPLDRVEPSVSPMTRPNRRRMRLAAALAVAAALCVAFWPAIEDQSARLLPGLFDQSATGDLRLRPGVAEPRSAVVAADPPQPIPTNPRRASLPAPAFASHGTAMFLQADRDSPSIVRADHLQQATLRITRIVDDQFRNFHARLSPDGRFVAFDSDREGERAVYVANADGTQVRRVSGSGFAAVPSWSPDGLALAFVRAEPARPEVWNVWTANVGSRGLEGSSLTRVTADDEGQPWGASWFPDGRRLAYGHLDEIVVLDLVTGDRRVFASPANGKTVRTPIVSPDGRRLVFQIVDDGGWLLDLGDGSFRKALSDSSAENYVWSPDGRRVAYHSRQSGQWGTVEIGS